MQINWQQLRTREKISVTTAAVLLVIVVIYRLLIAPIVSHYQTQLAQYRQNKTDLVLMQQQAQTILQLRRHLPAAATDQPLLNVVVNAIDQLGLRSQAKVDEDNQQQIHVNFTQVSFDDAMRMLALIEKQQAVHVVQMQASALQAGTVSLSLTLK